MPYIRPHPSNPFEGAVKEAGYDWFTTTTLKPGDRLNPHQHQSHNTHLIHRGQLTFYGPRSQLPTLTIDANSDDPNDREYPVEPGVRYRAIAGSEGAKFTEAHTILSPESARRMKIGWRRSAANMTGEQWCAQHRDRRLQEGVHFEPVDQDGLPFEQYDYDSDSNW